MGGIPEPVERALEVLAGTPVLLIALDFDGTLSAFVDDPGNARTHPRSKAAIERLTRMPGTFVAYISGRPIESLARVTEASSDALLVGSHGVELRLDGSHTELTLEPREQELLSELDSALSRIVERYPKAGFERKPAGRGIHTRLLSADDAERAQSAARAAAAALGDGVTVRGGKDIVEFAVRSATKGDGVRRLKEHVGASAVLFAGDDVTDEDGFEALGVDDVGIKVGDGETAAGYRVADPAAIADVLTLLAALRQAQGPKGA